MPALPQPLLSYDALCSVMDETPLPHELWDGRLIQEPAPDIEHQRVTAYLFRRLADFVERNQLGEVLFAPVDMLLAPNLCLQPDIVYVSAENRWRVDRILRGPADLAMEVLSWASRTRDRVEKRARYEAFGVKEYWIVDPERRAIDVLTLEANGRYRNRGPGRRGGTARSRLLPGFHVVVSAVFP
jgi:Uma2 family endonuclease